MQPAVISPKTCGVGWNRQHKFRPGHWCRLVRPASARDESVSQSQSLGIVPKGLRSFDLEDADFFLRLVPGARDRNGIPESIRQWKTWVESATPDDAHRMGVIYGPSGCGKSSLVRAGLVPNLDSHVTALVIDTEPGDMEERVLKQLRARFPGLPTNLTLTQTLAEFRSGRQLPSGCRLLLVFDQFEQWLHARTDYETSELMLALRQCDGVHVQSLLLVRDEFFLAITRFASLLEVPLLQGRNMMVVDLFDPIHARKVLLMFGRAYDRLPDDGRALSADNDKFLDKTVSLLESDGKIFPVRLALFAEMTKGRPWTSTTVDSLGGVEGVGARFLDEAFSVEHAPANQRVHERGARGILELFLPSPGMSLKGQTRTRGELSIASGYAEGSHEFDALLQIMDNDLRLVTPTETIQQNVNGTDEKGSASYRLTHDYLVPSIREWISRQDRQTRLGRLRLQLLERTELWSAYPQKRSLPSWWEWIKFRCLLNPRRWNDQEQKLMQVATRHYLSRTAVVGCLLLAVGWSLARFQSYNNAMSILGRLQVADIENVSSLLGEIRPHFHDVEQPLRELYEKSNDGAQEKFVSSLALAQSDPAFMERLFEQLLLTTPIGILQSRDTLKTHGQDRADWFWKRLNDEQETTDRRFRAALVLAQLDPPLGAEPTNKWSVHDELFKQELVNASVRMPEQFQALTELGQPAESLLVPLLAQAIGVEKPSAEDVSSTNLLVALLPKLIDKPKAFSHLETMSTWQVSHCREYFDDSQHTAVLDVLRDIIKLDVTEADSRDAAARTVANAAALLARNGRASEVWHLLRYSPEPDVRSYLIRRFEPFRIALDDLTQQLDQEDDPGIRAAILLALGEYVKRKEDLTGKLHDSVVRIHANDVDPGVHGAAEWFLRKCGIDTNLPEGAQPNTSTSQASWRVIKNGHTMIRIAAPNENIASRAFEIGTMEVSVEQFKAYRQSAHYNTDTTDSWKCPMNAVRWNQAIDYCQWLTDEEGIPENEFCYEKAPNGDWVAKENHLDYIGYRLPISEEWKVACRANTSTLRYFAAGERLTGEYAWYEGNSELKSRPCGTLRPNQWGMFDTLGNVMEWCDNVSIGDAAKRIVRGGRYGDVRGRLSFVLQRDHPYDSPFNSLGFRVARTARDSSRP